MGFTQSGKSSSLGLMAILLAAVSASIQLSAQAVPAPIHVFFRIQTASSISTPVSGRLLIFLKQGSGDKEVSVSEFRPEDTWVAAREVHDLTPGTAIEFDADELAYPKAFSALPAGDYEAQAVLGLDGDAVEDIQFRDLQDVFDRSKFTLGGTHDGRAHFECPIRDRSSVVHEPLLRFASQYLGHLIDDCNNDPALPGLGVP